MQIVTSQLTTFTMPFREDVELLETAPEKARAQAYDLVLNGYELGGGSLHIYERDVQEKCFKSTWILTRRSARAIRILIRSIRIRYTTTAESH